MNMSAQAYNQYRKTTVETVSPGRLLIMLFDGALKNINLATKAINDKDVNLAHSNIIKTQDIIMELMSTLDMDYEISKNLYSLYDYMLNRLIEANVSKDTTILAETATLLQEMRDTWQEVVQNTANISSNKPNNMANISLKG